VRLLSLFTSAVLATHFLAGVYAQSHTVALTVDDLPFVIGDGTRPMLPRDGKAAAAANKKLLRGFRHHHLPVTGFAIQNGTEDLGPNSGTTILHTWVRGGLDLGNHTYAHSNFNDLSVEQFEDQIIRGEATIVPLMSAAGRKVEFFRFPANHTGDTKEKHDAVANFLAERGYRLAPCTIETSDWMFDQAYALMLARKDRASAARLRTDYLAFTGTQIDYFQRLNTQVFGYEPPQIMLIHDNQLNADVIEKLLALFEKRQYRWVSLSVAESDPAYKISETFITKYGPMWGYRWAKERGVPVDGSLEPDPPKWITDYGKNEPVAPRRPRS